MSTNVIDMEAWLGRPGTEAETLDDRPEYVIEDDAAVYSVIEVSRLLKLSRGGTYELVRQGVIPAVRLGKRWVIPKQRFHAWLDSCVEGAS